MMRTPLHLARRAGVGLVTAIFLLVVLSGLGVAMVTLYTAQQAGSSLDIEGARAYQAARAGMEFGLYQLRQRASCPGSASPTILAAQQFQNAPTLRGYTVVVTCAREQGMPNAPANITSVACNLVDANGRCDGAQNDPQYVRRRMEVSA
jgi:MSHA biogenesis protein MshP